MLTSSSKPILPRACRYASVSLGQGQEPIAEQRLADFHKRGGWLLLQNIHLTIDWTTTVLDARVDKLSEGAHPDFRCWPLLPGAGFVQHRWLCPGAFCTGSGQRHVRRSPPLQQAAGTAGGPLWIR